LRIFLYAGSLDFHRSYLEYNGRKISSLASKYIEKANDYRQKLFNIVIEKAVPGAKIEFVRKDIGKLLNTKAEKAKRNEITKQASLAREERKRLEREKTAAKLAAQMPKEKIKHDDVPLQKSLAIFEEKVVLDKELGQKAAEEFTTLIREHKWWEASQKYNIAQRNSDINTVNYMRNDADTVLGRGNNRFDIDIGVLGFAWRWEYRFLRDRFFQRRADLVKELQRGIEYTTLQMAKKLEDPGFDDKVQAQNRKPASDPRPRCEIIKDVAEAMAEGMRWPACLEIVKAECKEITIDDKARMIGAFSKGIRRGLEPSNYKLACKVLEFANSLIEKIEGSTELQAAMVSLEVNIQHKIRNDEPEIVPYTEALIKTGAFELNQTAASPEHYSEILGKCKMDCIHFIAVIEQAYNKRKFDMGPVSPWFFVPLLTLTDL
jgi:hypothetical protein